MIATILAGALFGSRGALSAALGGVACIVPTGLFAIRLLAVTKRSDASFPVAFFLGEMIKLLLCIGLLAAVRLVFPGVHWGAVLIGLIVTLQANFFALLVKT